MRRDEKSYIMCSGVETCRWNLPSMSEVHVDSLRLLLALRRGRREQSDDLPGEDTRAAAERLPSFQALLQLYHKKIYNLLYRLIGNFDEAADLTQETFVRAYGAYPRFRGEVAAVYPWLCRIGINACKNKFKELSRRSTHEVRSLDEPVRTAESNQQFEVGDDSADPLGLVQRRELGVKVQGALESLPVEYRMVVILRDMDGLSYKEIVDATGLTMETVKSRLFRARGMLRRRLAAYVEG